MRTNPGPEIEQFITTVHQMRLAQTRYFRTRSKGSLAEAKYLEAKVDRWLEQEMAHRVQQGQLFR